MSGRRRREHYRHWKSSCHAIPTCTFSPRSLCRLHHLRALHHFVSLRIYHQGPWWKCSIHASHVASKFIPDKVKRSYRNGWNTAACGKQEMKQDAKKPNNDGSRCECGNHEQLAGSQAGNPSRSCSETSEIFVSCNVSVESAWRIMSSLGETAGV